MKQKSIFKDILKLVTGVICTAGIATMAGIAVYFTVPSAKDKIDKHFKWNDYSNTQIENLAKISDYENQIKDLNSKKVDYENQIKDLNSKKSEYEIELKKLNDEKTADKNKILELNTKITDCENKIEDLKSKFVDGCTLTLVGEFNSFQCTYPINDNERVYSVIEESPSNEWTNEYMSDMAYKFYALNAASSNNCTDPYFEIKTRYMFTRDNGYVQNIDFTENSYNLSSSLNCNVTYYYNNEETTYQEISSLNQNSLYSVKFEINFNVEQNLLNVKALLKDV